jgi:Metallo-beta-lactamase superfamily/Transposase
MSIVGAFDVHRRQLTFDYLDTVTGEVRRGRVVPADREHLRAWLARFAGQDDVHFAVEGCTGWRYVTEELAAKGIIPHLAEPADTAALRGRTRHAKTDKTDSRHLRVHLAAGDLPECWLPPGHVLETRATVRLYKDLLDERGAWHQRIAATLFHQGVPVTASMSTAQGRAAVAEMELSPAGRQAVDTALRQIDRLTAISADASAGSLRQAPGGVGQDDAMRVRFVGSGDAFGSGGRWQTCIHLTAEGQVLLIDCGATSPVALKAQGLDPNAVGAVAVTHLHGDHFGGLPFLILDGQFCHRSTPLLVAGPPGIQLWLAEAMETLFPGSSRAHRRFPVEVTELALDGTPATLSAAIVRGWQVEHACGATPAGAAGRTRRRELRLLRGHSVDPGADRGGAGSGPVRRGGIHLRPADPLPPQLPDAARAPAPDPRGTRRAHPHVCHHAQQTRRRRTPRSL